MTESVVWLTIFVLAVFVGVEVISKVSSTLHTPLMSGRMPSTASSWSARSWWPARADSTPILISGLVAVFWPPSTWSAGSSSRTGCWRCSAARRRVDKPSIGKPQQ